MALTKQVEYCLIHVERNEKNETKTRKRNCDAVPTLNVLGPDTRASLAVHPELITNKQ